MQNLTLWVWMSMAMGPGNKRIWDILSRYDNIAEFYNKINNGDYSYLKENEKRAFMTTHISQAESIISSCKQKEINIICYDDEGYPLRLREIFNPPTVLFCYGNLDFIDDNVCIGVVGARHPSDYSVKVAEKICTELACVSTVLISGFAYGIDSIAHKCALKSKTKTVAVLGCGIDYDYPQENTKIKKVIGKCGAVITEFFPGTRPDRKTFPMRNRIISALSLGILVVEASATSGALNTASHALTQGKDIFCIPPADIFDTRYEGVVNLIRDGAIPVFSHMDIMYEYYENYSHRLKTNNAYDNYTIKTVDSFVYKKENKALSKDEAGDILADTKVKKEKDTSSVSMLSPLQTSIVEVLRENGTMTADEITVSLEESISVILTELTELELIGCIKSFAGMRYSL